MKLAEKEEEERTLKKVVADLCVELPQCHIDPEAPLLQTVKVIAGRSKELKEKVETLGVE